MSYAHWYEVGYRRGYDRHDSPVSPHDTPTPEGQQAASDGFRDGQRDRQRDDQRQAQRR